MNPRNTFYRDSRALSPSLSLSLLLLSFFLSFIRERRNQKRERERERTLTLYDDSVSQSSRGLAGILSRGTTNERQASVETRKRNGPRADDIFSLDGWDTGSRVYTRESSMPRREETAGVGRYTHKRRNAILIIGCDYLCRVTPSHREAGVYSSSSSVLVPYARTFRHPRAQNLPTSSSLLFSFSIARFIGDLDQVTFNLFAHQFFC